MVIQKKYLYLLIALLVLPIVAVFSYFMFRDSSEGESIDDLFKSCKIDTSLKYYFVAVENRVTTPENVWTQHYLQPIYMGIEKEKGINYIVGALPDASNNCVKVRFIATGDIPIEDSSGLTNKYNDIEWGEERVSLNTFEERVEVGKQFRVRYLSKAPLLEELTDEKCNSFGDGSQYYCTIQRIHQEYLKYDSVELLWTNNIEAHTTLYGTAYDLQLTITGENE